ncbi:hypothetical protein ACLI4Z_09255 [Natrialbaceae archaeon A-arb3/5]
MSGVDERIEEYRSRLAPDDRREFDQRLETTFDDLEREEIYDELDSELGQSESHLELIIATASAFHQNPIADGYSSGYRFAFTEPLEEQNSDAVGEEEVKNGDVLLAKEEDEDVYLCVIECKAGSTAGRDWVQELEEIEEVINTDGYREKLKEQLGVEGKEIRHEQYVLLGRITQIHSMNYDQIDDDVDIPPNYAFWGYDLGDQQMVNIHGEVRDHELAGVINDSIDAGKIENPINFTYGDHPITKLQVLVEEIVAEKSQDEDEHPFEFDRSEFYEKFDEELQVGFTGEIREQLVEEEVNSLLEAGVEIDLFTTSSDRLKTSRDYRILFKGKRIKAAKRAVETKFLEHRSEVKYKERAFKDVKEDFTPEQTRLDEQDWGDDDEEDDEEDGDEGAENG